MTDRDITRQIVAYTEILDAAAPPVDDLAPVTIDTGPKDRVEDLADHRRRPVWAVVAGAAAVVAVVVGAVAVISSIRDETAPPATSLPPTSVAPSLGTHAVLVSPNPVIDTTDTLPGPDFYSFGDVVMVDGTFHALLGGEMDPPAFYHASSPDGTAWTVDADPVASSDLSDVKSVRATELIELDDGTWVGYFDYGRDLGGVGDHRYRFWIHRGTAPAVDGPWTIDPTPVLDAGPDGTWDGGWVRNASVVSDGDGWLMFYLGGSEVTDGSGAGAVGIARSPDGITWTREPDPVFAGDASQFEEGKVNRIEVKRVDDEYLLTYAGRTGGNRGVATSVDGMSWQRDIRNPILTTIEVPRGSIYDTALVDDDGVLRWYAAAGGFRSMAVYELRLER